MKDAALCSKNTGGCAGPWEEDKHLLRYNQHEKKRTGRAPSRSADVVIENEGPLSENFYFLNDILEHSAQTESRNEVEEE